METTFKNFILCALFVLASGFSTAVAQENSAKETAAVQQAVDQSKVVIYSIENVTSGLVIEDLKQLNRVAGGALTIKLAAEISVRFQTAMELLTHIIKSKDIPEEKKQALVDPLAEAIGDLFMFTIRHHRDDPLKMNYAKAPDVWDLLKRTGIEFLNIPSDVFGVSPKIKRNADGSVSQQWNGANADDKRVMWFWDRIVRNYISREAIQSFQKAAMEIGDMPDSKEDGAFRALIYVKKKENGNDLADVERALAIRKSRVVPHLAAFGSLVGAGVLWTFGGFDFIGMFSGDYSAGNVRVVDTIVFGVLSAVALAKTATASFGSIPPMKRLIEMAMEPGKKHEFSKMSLPLTARIAGLKKKMDAARGQVACKLSVGSP